jgi:hypothetical protein
VNVIIDEAKTARLEASLKKIKFEIGREMLLAISE